MSPEVVRKSEREFWLPDAILCTCNVSSLQESKFPRQIKDICGYFQCAPFLRLETGKVVRVLSFDH